VLCSTTKLNNVAVRPSNKIYFNSYPYKISFVGDKVNYDPIDHFVLNQFMFGEGIVDKREYWTYNCRCIYFVNYRDVENICEVFSDLVEEVQGPISVKHIKLLQAGKEVRESLFFNCYDTRIEFYQTGSRYDREQKDKILSFVDLNFEDFRWFSSNFSWGYNYLYCHDTDLQPILPYMKLAFGNHMYSIAHAYTYSDL